MSGFQQNLISFALLLVSEGYAVVKTLFAQFPVRSVLLALGLVAILIFIYDIGYNEFNQLSRQIPTIYFVLLNSFIFLNIAKLLFFFRESSRRSQLAITLFFIAALLYLLAQGVQHSLQVAMEANMPLLRFCALLFFVIEYSVVVERFYSSKMQPAFIFAVSFIVLIFSGALLLKLPMATTSPISFIDALFTSTSAVCVTGLVVLDTNADFTTIGKIIIMLLFQAGGIGMLTLTSFFAYFFKENLSYRERLFVMDFISSNRLSNIFQMTVSIVAITFAVELLGAFFIFINIPSTLMPGIGERLFFSVFHSISAFCNAGFSTMTNGLYEDPFRFNYAVQIAIAVLVIFGGLGYNIMFNVIEYIIEKPKILFSKYVLKTRNYRKRVRIVTLNTKIVIYTSLILIVFGMIFFFFSEYRNALAEHKTFFGKVVTSFFGSITPRTAGFNTVDVGGLNISTIMITILLMWIGASPASTGGGIKTSTFAIATLNIFSMARGRNKTTVGRRIISDYNVKKTFSIISMSLIFIGLGILVIASLEPKAESYFLQIIFECFSAYSTVGLSMGITPKLTDVSKLTLIILMFIGRVGAINLLIGMLHRLETQHLKYPEEEILIN